MRKQINRVLIANPQGFTLVEVLIALAISGIVMGSIYSVFLYSHRNYRTQERVTNIQQQVRVGLDFLADGIRMAGMDPLGSTNAGLEIAAGSKIRFTSDQDLNGVIDAPLNQERITYSYDAATQSLQRGIYEGTPDEEWQTLINKVSSLNFSYLDSNGVPGTPIRSVLITLECEDKDAQNKTIKRKLQLRIICRNLYLL